MPCRSLGEGVPLRTRPLGRGGHPHAPQPVALPLLWAAVYLTIQSPVVMVQIGGVMTGIFLIGVVWAVWHLGMLFTPDGRTPDPWLFGLHVIELALYSVVFAWVFERGGRSMAVAFALHAGAHLDNTHQAALSEPRLEVLRLVALAVAAALAARALRRDHAAITAACTA